MVKEEALREKGSRRKRLYIPEMELIVEKGKRVEEKTMAKMYTSG